MRIATLIAAFALAVGLAGPALADPPAGRAGDIVVTGAEVRASLGDAPNTAAYMVIENTGGRPDRLLSVTCACADEAKVHITRAMNGMMMMEPAGPVVVPAHGRLALRPGAMHVMLTGLKGRLVDGGRQAMTLTFERAGPVRVSFRVRDRIGGGEMGPMPGMSH
jgi:hypothetical protein